MPLRPHGWHQIYQLNNDAVRLADFVPQGQTNLAWKTKLSFESHSDLVDLDPIEILLSEAKKTKKSAALYSTSISFRDTRTTTQRL